MTAIIRFLLLFFSLSGVIYANPTANEMKAALEVYQQGKYEETIALLDKVHGDAKTMQSIWYWQAQCYFKLKKYNEAIEKFNASLKHGVAAEDIYYALAQSYYASQNLAASEKFFKKSYLKKYKPMASAYYIGYILQVQNKNKQANKYYSHILKHKNDDEKVKQAAIFQMAEMRYELTKRISSKNRKNRVLEDVVLPFYERAMDYESDTITYSEAKTKVDEINALVNSAKPPKYLTFRAIMEVGYDSNVISKADQSVTEISHKDSMFIKPSFYANYSKRFRERWEFNAGIRNVFKYYQRRHTPNVYKNDNITIEPSLEIARDHTLFSKTATTSLSGELTYMLQDYLKMHQFPFYSRAYNFELSEKANPFSTGLSTLKGNIKFYENAVPTQNSLQPGVEYNQKTKVAEGARLSTSLTIDWLFGRTASDDTTTYSIKNRLPIDISPTFTITPKFNFSVLDSKFSKATRGYEKKYNPGLAFRKVFRNGIIGKFSYEYTRNLSLDKVNQQYKRHEADISMEVKF